MKEKPKDKKMTMPVKDMGSSLTIAAPLETASLVIPNFVTKESFEKTMKDNEIKLNYDDVDILPEVLTECEHRAECNPFDEEDDLPIFAAPMSTVVSMENIETFNQNKIKVVIPRNYDLETRISYLISKQRNFVSFSLDEAFNLFILGEFDGAHPFWGPKEMTELRLRPLRICIDLANGHMTKLIDICKSIKKKWGNNIIIMTGNIANAETYRIYEEAGVDYVRCGIGSGDFCLTASNTGVHCPMFSLIKDVYEIKKKINGKCKIIADGGIKCNRDIQKALLYADYVMIGSLFNHAIDSAGKTTYGKSYRMRFGEKKVRFFKTLFTFGKEIKPKDYEKALKEAKNGTLDIWKVGFGMSTKEAQKQINQASGRQKSLKTSEGKVKHSLVTYDIKGWVENERDALRSTMSYTNSVNLEEYKEGLWVRITNINYNK